MIGQGGTAQERRQDGKKTYSVVVASHVHVASQCRALLAARTWRGTRYVRVRAQVMVAICGFAVFRGDLRCGVAAFRDFERCRSQ